MVFAHERYKNLLFGFLALFILYSCSFSKWEPTSSLEPNIDYINQADISLAEEPLVIIYATSWCYWCSVAKKFMAKQNIKFSEKNYENPKERERLNQFAKEVGYTGRLNSVPIFIVNKTVIVGYNPEQLLCEIGRRKNCKLKLFTTWETPIRK